eukprot:m.163498 g.163498  ORF g.163498 m.163498 type:complete len:270 (-) comp31293_c2_seq4:1633-2442(-)
MQSGSKLTLHPPTDRQDNTSNMSERPMLGVLTGISYVSGLDYYRGINEGYAKIIGKGEVIPPNPLMLVASVDCDKYAMLLINKQWTGVEEHLLIGVDCLVRGGINLLCIASNTGHLAYDAIRLKHPDLEVLHIADCTAREIKKQGLKKIGLIGTQPTMQENYLKDRLKLHGLEVITPDESELKQIFQFIMDELGSNIFKDTTRAYFVTQLKALRDMGAEGVILGCTEIELLVNQTHVSDIPLFPSAEIHIRAAAACAAGTEQVSEFTPQ